METHINKRFVRLFILSAVITGIFLSLPQAAAKPVNHIFMFIGDGMGLAQRSIAEMYLKGILNDPNAKLAMNSLPVQGIMTTLAADKPITDSAASATAFACGQKTNVGFVGVDKDKNRLTSIADILKAQGYKIGIVTTSSIDNATAAAFYAHQESRKSYYEICSELAQSGFDYLAGGGAMGEKPEIRQDKPSIVQAMKDKGYSIITTKAELEQLKKGAGKVWAYNYELDDQAGLFYEKDRPSEHASLIDYVRKGIELLSDANDPNNKFFMVIEGGNIDHACHKNDAAAMVHEVLALDQAVCEAVKFYGEHPDNTLIVIFADHETGGLGMGRNGGSKFNTDSLTKQKCSAEMFTARLKKLYDANSPYDTVANEIGNSFGLTNLSDNETLLIQRAYKYAFKIPDAGMSEDEAKALYGNGEPVTITCTQLVSVRAGIGWTTMAHTAIPVPVSAAGVGSSAFDGYFDNTAIFQNLQAITTPQQQ